MNHTARRREWAAVCVRSAAGAVLAACLTAACGGNGVDPATDIVIEPISFDTNVVPGTSAAVPARINAALYLPPGGARVARAVVILPSSSGVQQYREVYYARAFAAAGTAALIVDSFRSRGIASAVDDQTAISSFQLENDAFAALHALRAHGRIGTAPVAVFGVSKGGTAALNAAFLVRETWRRTTLRFAAHVAVSPGCEVTHRSMQTTGARVHLLLAELDDYAPPQRCAHYAEQIGSTVTVQWYEGAHHGWERIGELQSLPNAEVFGDCPAVMEDDGRLYVAALGRAVSTAEYVAHARDTCVRRGAHSGGGTAELKERAARDIMAFFATEL